MDLFSSRTYLQNATTGIWTVADAIFYSIELPWDNNLNDQSCIPPGDYELIRYQSPAHGQTWCFHNPTLGVWATPDLIPAGTVGARSYSELHSANWARQLLGCCALGLNGQPMIDPATGQAEPAVEDSVDAIERFTELVGGWIDGLVVHVTCASGTEDPTLGYLFTGG